jgi:hypothetical protein
MEGAAVEALEAPTETDLTHQGKSKFHMNVVKYCSCGQVFFFLFIQVCVVTMILTLFCLF